MDHQHMNNSNHIVNSFYPPKKYRAWEMDSPVAVAQ